MNVEFSEIAVALIDADALSTALVQQYLGELGVKRVDVFTSGMEGWRAAKGGSYHMIVMDWKLNDISGAGLFNRLREERGLALTPVVCITSSIGREDFSLTSEFPCSVLVQKPLVRQEFVSRVEDVWKESQSYRTYDELVEQLMSAINNETNDVEKFFNRLWTRLPNPIPVSIMAARRLRERGMLELAEKILRKMLEYNHKIIPIIAELGKVLHLQDRHADALRVLAHAQSFSPNNLTRLLLIGQIQLEQMRPEEARTVFKQALDIDPENTKAQQGTLVADNLAEHVSANPPGVQLPRTFAGVMNIIGISMVKQRRHGEGIKQYEAAMYFVNDSKDIARLSFNMGLGFLRWGKLERSLEWFIKAGQLDRRLRRKSEDYQRIAGERIAAQGGNIVGIGSATANGADGRSTATVFDQSSFEVPDSKGNKKLKTKQSERPVTHLQHIEEISEDGIDEEDAA